MMLARDPYAIGFAAMTPFFHVGTLSDRLAATALGGAGGLPIAATSGEARENAVALGTGFPFQATAGASYLVLQLLAPSRRRQYEGRQG